MKKILVYLLPYRNKLIWAALFTAFATVCDLMLPTLMSSIVVFIILI